MKFFKLLTIIIASFVFVGCSHIATDSVSESVPAAVVTSGEAVQLNASNFTFKVEKIEANVGDELVVVITNDNGIHDFMIDELDINTGIIKEGNSIRVTIPTDKPGTYEYYCSVGNHRSLGMKGVLIIK